MKAICLALVLSLAVFGQSSKPHGIKFSYHGEEETPGLPPVYRLASGVLFNGFKTVLPEAVHERFVGLKLSADYQVTVTLTARQREFGPQYVVVRIKSAKMSEREVYRFRLSLETDLANEAAVVSDRLAEVTKPQPPPKKGVAHARPFLLA